MTRPTIVVFRQDLRTEDHGPLSAAAACPGGVVPAYVFAESDIPIGSASRWWLPHSLNSLGDKLKELGSPLILRVAEAYGSWEEAVSTLAHDLKAGAVYWHRGYEPEQKRQDAALLARLAADGVEAKVFSGALLWDPQRVATLSGEPYKVFTPFYRTCLQQPIPTAPLKAPAKINPPKQLVLSLKLSDLPLNRRVSWATGMATAWAPGEPGAHRALNLFCKFGIEKYPKSRDFPADERGISHLSPHLHFGEISPRQIWAAAKKHGKAAEPFLRQLVWREFALYSLFHIPKLAVKNMRSEFDRFQWRKPTVEEAGLELEAWRRGRTGIPIVDAGMRELWRTGWMHGRVRMIVGSLLVKNLRVHWHEGANWFWDTLIDADLANNSMGWQWIAGTGFDAAPYFRVFNPILQGKKFDPDGTYIKRWIPELQSLPVKFLFAPWKADEKTLAEHNVVLGRNYPKPIVDLDESRKQALAAFKKLKARP